VRPTPSLPWLPSLTRYVLFTGKGGVGKTTIASASALRLADAGVRTLIVSTDPASNLDDAFGIDAGGTPTPVPGAPTLRVLNIDPVAAAAAYRERMVAPYRGLLPHGAIRGMEEQLAGACTVEIAAFNEFTALLSGAAIARDFDAIVFDTAPTGHTLRLLSLPSAWSDFLETSTSGASCLGPLAGLEQHKAQYQATVAALADARLTTVFLVARPEESALREAARAGMELAALGIRHQRLVVNGVHPLAWPGRDASAVRPSAPHVTDRVAAAWSERQRRALSTMPSSLAALPVTFVPLTPTDTNGLDALRHFAAIGGSSADTGAPAVAAAAPAVAAPGGFGTFEDLVETLATSGGGLVMTMGKGGVGKTTVAVEIARALARRGHAVHLSTTDPAAHVQDAVGHDRPELLELSRIDPAAETARYSAEVLEAAEVSAGEEGMSADERALLREDLRSPCTEEIGVFRAFARTVAKAQGHFVVLDTAPTGHTLLLLDAAESYQREVVRTAGSHVPPEVRALLQCLRDQAFTRMLLVTLAERTPVHEAERLQDDLRRAGIEPFGWVVNASVAATSTRDPLLVRRAELEHAHLARVREVLAERAWLIPWQP
jgi:arsenite/tail-anchored protein-transporting ATPase